MIDANRGTNEETLRRLKEASYERFSIELIGGVEKLLDDFNMNWDDLAGKLQWFSGTTLGTMTGDRVKQIVGAGVLNMGQINDIAHVFSMEPYILFRPRFPYTQS